MFVALPRHVEEILNKLQAAGFEAYLVGGCVRDTILGRTPEDWDITTNALPAQVMQIFPHCIPTGLVHGTVTVLWKAGFSAEITTYRKDGVYEDGRHPKEVSFSGTIQEDLSRRDFTVNAIAYSPTAGFIDLFEGQQHILQKRICCVGDPLLRFSEDALRMLRALRFSAVLDFSIDPAILDAITQLHSSICKVSIERIQAEFTKMLLADCRQVLPLLMSTGLLSQFLPQLEELPDLSFFHKLPQRLPCRLAFLLQELPIQTVKQILKGLRYSNAVCNQTLSILYNMDAGLPATETELRKRMAEKQSEPGLADYLEIQQFLTPDAERMLQFYYDILKRKDCTNLSMLAVNGNTLEKIGITQGHKKGTVLQALLQAVLENPKLNTEEQLIDIALKIR